MGDVYIAQGPWAGPNDPEWEAEISFPIDHEGSCAPRPVSVRVKHIVQWASCHSLHKTNETPEGNGIILHGCIYGREEIAHSLNVAQLVIVFIIR